MGSNSIDGAHIANAHSAAGKGFILSLLYAARNLRSRCLFRALQRYCHGNVLDIGGYDFYLTARRQGLQFSHWTTIEPKVSRMPVVSDPQFTAVCGDGCNMVPFKDSTFDTVLCIQVVEHVFEPIRMVSEIGRVLKPGGRAILLVPQTSTLHMAPHHYYNFTRYWILEALKRARLELVTLEPLGGRWSTTASHFVYFFLQSTGYPGMVVPGQRRGALFYLLYPLMAVYALVSIPLCMLLSLGDLCEEPNNHLVVACKRT